MSLIKDSLIAMNEREQGLKQATPFKQTFNNEKNILFRLLINITRKQCLYTEERLRRGSEKVVVIINLRTILMSAQSSLPFRTSMVFPLLSTAVCYMHDAN